MTERREQRCRCRKFTVFCYVFSTFARILAGPYDSSKARLCRMYPESIHRSFPRFIENPAPATRAVGEKWWEGVLKQSSGANRNIYRVALRLATLKAVETTSVLPVMAYPRIASHVRTHRKKSGFTQREVARLVGYTNQGPVSRHERGIAVPPLSVALAYAALFRVSVADLFPAIHEKAGSSVETRLARFESALGQRSARAGDANATARKLQFIWARKNGVEI